MMNFKQAYLFYFACAASLSLVFPFLVLYLAVNS